MRPLICTGATDLRQKRLAPKRAACYCLDKSRGLRPSCRPDWLENQISLLRGLLSRILARTRKWQCVGIQARLTCGDLYIVVTECTSHECRSKELNVPNPCPKRELLRFVHQAPVVEFRPESAEAFRACSRHPTKTSAEEFVLLFTFQAEAEGFLVKAAKFLGGFHPFG